MLGFKACIQGFNTFPCKVHLLNELQVMNYETAKENRKSFHDLSGCFKQKSLAFDNLILEKSRGMDVGMFYSHLVFVPCQKK